MSMERMIKWLAFITILGGVARVGMTPSSIIWGVDSIPELLFGLIACLLMGIGIFGVHMYQANRVGTFGFVSVVLISVSSTLTAALVWSTMLGITFEDHAYIDVLKPINALASLVGMIGFGVLTIRARIFPIWCVVLYLLFPVMSFIPSVSGWAATAWGLSYIGFGYYAFANKSVGSSSSLGAAA